MSKDLFNLEAVIESASKKFIEGEEVLESAILSESVLFAIEESVTAGNEHVLFESVAYETSIAVLEAKSEKEEDEDEEDEDNEDEDKEDKEDDDDKEDDEEKCVDESLLKSILESDASAEGEGESKEGKGGAWEKTKARGAKIAQALGEAWKKLAAMFTNIVNQIKSAALTKLNVYEKFATAHANDIIAGAKHPRAKEVTLKNAYNYSNIGKVNVKSGEKFLSEISTYVRSKGASLIGLEAVAKVGGKIGDKEKALLAIPLDEISKAAVTASMKQDFHIETTEVRTGVAQFARGKKLNNLSEIGGQELIHGLKGTKPMLDAVKKADTNIKEAAKNAAFAGKLLAKSENFAKEGLDYISRIDALYRVAYSFELNQQLGYLDAIKSRGLSFYQMAKAAAKLSGAKIEEAKPEATKEEAKATNESLVNDFLAILQ